MIGAAVILVLLGGCIYSSGCPMGVKFPQGRGDRILGAFLMLTGLTFIGLASLSANG